MIPILVNTSEPMLKVRVVTVKDYSQKTLEYLQKLGVLHVEEARELSPVDRAAIEKEMNEVRTALNYLNNILEHLASEKTVFLPEVIKPRPLGEITDQARNFHNSVSSLTRKYDRLQEEVVNLEYLGKYLGILAGETNASLKDLQYSGNYLFTDVLVLTEESYKTFSEKANQYLLQDTTITADGDVVIYFIAMSENRMAIETLIRELGTTKLIIPDEELTLNEFIAQNDETIRKGKSESEKLQQEIQKSIEGDLDQIVLFREILVSENERLSVLQQACEARYVTLVEGFVPESNADAITSGLKEIIDYVYIETKKPSPTDEPPTRLRNTRGIRPFEVIVSLFSLPKYGDWDPTPSVAYFFAFFFGLMLNDVIYAICLLLATKFLLNKLVDDPDSEGIRLFRKVLYICGTTSLVMGILSGTYMGDFFHKFFHVDLKSLAVAEVIQKQLSDPILFIIFSLLLGLVHVNLAHLLALIRGVKKGNNGLVVSKIGIFITEIFGIPYIFYSLLNIQLLPMSAGTYAIFVYPMIAGLALIIISGFMQVGAQGSISWIFELTGILGDIMSYSRLAGVGLATFYLASSFNLLAEWVASGLLSLIPGILGVIISFIVGFVLFMVLHTMNLFLSSLAAFIHSLRLCFVEFLLKFYEGGGREYAPFHLRLREEVIVGKKS